MFLNELKDIVWQFVQIVEEYNFVCICKDVCGVWIVYVDFNNCNSFFGWELDYIYFVLCLKLQNVLEELWDNLLNICVFYWQNNQSKGNFYFMYMVVVLDEGVINMKCEVVYLVNEVL